MEPVAVHSQLVSLLRLSGTAAVPSPAELLSGGRALAGQVLAELAQGTLLLAQGPHRPAADSEVAPREGETFPHRLERGVVGPALRALGPREGAPEPPLLRALRAVVAQDRPVGELHEELATEARRALSAAVEERPRLEALLARLERGVLRPNLGESPPERGVHPPAGAGARSPAARISAAQAVEAPQQSVLPESVAAARESPHPTSLLARARAAGLDLPALAAAAAARIPGGARPEQRERDLLSALLRAVRELSPGAERSGLLAGVHALSTERLTRLAAAPPAEAGGGGDPRGRAAEIRSGAGRGLLPAGRELLRLVAESGLEYEARLFAALAAERPEHALRGLAVDLKAELLSALAALPEGAVHRALVRTLAGLEAEQLLNLARREGGEPVHVSFPLADGAHLATVHLFVEPCGEEQRGRGRPRSAPRRLVLGAELSALGPVRVDLTLRPGLLHVRLLAAREEVAALLAREARDLADRLAAQGLRVVLTAVHARLEDVDLSLRARDVAWLRWNPLMDVSG